MVGGRVEEGLTLALEVAKEGELLTRVAEHDNVVAVVVGGTAEEEDWEALAGQLGKLKMPKNTFHSLVTDLLNPSDERKEKVPSWPRFICSIILWITSLILDVHITILVVLVNTI